MKRFTFEIDERLLARAEELAAARGVSVETMLNELLARETTSDSDVAAAARRRMGERARAATGGLGGWKWNREELYEERLSRHERRDLRGDGNG